MRTPTILRIITLGVCLGIGLNLVGCAKGDQAGSTAVVEPGGSPDDDLAQPPDEDVSAMIEAWHRRLRIRAERDGLDFDKITQWIGAIAQDTAAHLDAGSLDAPIAHYLVDDFVQITVVFFPQEGDSPPRVHSWHIGRRSQAWLKGGTGELVFGLKLGEPVITGVVDEDKVTRIDR